MSYILDALKKSEQERVRGTAPSVQTLHSSSINYHSSKSQLWPYFLLAAVVINLAAQLFFMMSQSDQASSARTTPVSLESEAAVPNIERKTVRKLPDANADEVSQADAIVYRPVAMPAKSEVSVNRTQTPVEIETPKYQQPAASIVELDELPLNILQHIPAMEFSAHVYSSNPIQRSMVINGRFMEEGDRLNSDLYLAEITPDGAIFNYQGQLFHQRVVSAWN